MDTTTTVPIIPKEDEYEQYIRQTIAAIQRAAEDAARPYVKELVRLQMMKPPRPIFVTREQAEPMRFLVP